MARRPLAITPSESTRFIKAAFAAGPSVGRVEFNPVTGAIVVTPATASGEPASARNAASVVTDRLAKLKP